MSFKIASEPLQTSVALYFNASYYFDASYYFAGNATEYWEPLQKQPPEVFCKKRFSGKFDKLYKKETVSQVFFCEFCGIFKNTFFTENLWTTACGTEIVEY